MSHPPPFRLALVTGASSGIGESLCHLLAAQGIPLLFTGRNERALSRLADALRSHVPVVVYVADLAEEGERAVLVKKIHELHPDLVINNAGFGFYGPATELDTKKQLGIIEVNATALTELSIEAGKALIEAKIPGVIVNVSSAAGFFPFPYTAVYAASKAYVNSFSQALDFELREKGIRVLAACPGMVATDFSARASGGKGTRSGQKKMSSDFAAEVIWKNILQKKGLFVFNWPYKIATFFTQYILPRNLLMYILGRVFPPRTRWLKSAKNRQK